MVVRPFDTAAAALLIATAIAVFGGSAPTAAAAPATDAAAASASHPIRVGPARSIKTIAEAARLAPDGATIEIDAGTYRGDVAVWTQDDLTLRSIGGRVRLIADGAAAEGKAIWVIRAERVSVEGFDFEGARVAGRNGAGIRFERGSLHVRDCSFTDNQSGILTGNDRDAVLEVEDSEFDSLHPEDGQNHHLYAGTISRLSVTGSYFHRGALGHLLKSRAALSLIRYNRLTDEDGSASYELEFPNGGLAYVVANIIQQSPRTDNPNIIAYGAEGYRWPVNEIYLVNNTVVDDTLGSGAFIRVLPGADRVQAVNNLWIGGGSLPAPDANADFKNNFAVDRAGIDAWPTGDYRLRPTSRAWGRAIPAGRARGQDLTATREFHFPRGSVATPSPASQPGALQSLAAALTPAR